MDEKNTKSHQEMMNSELAARKTDLALMRGQAQEWAAKAQEAGVMASRIEGAIQQLQALGATDAPPAPPVGDENNPE